MLKSIQADITQTGRFTGKSFLPVLAKTAVGTDGGVGHGCPASSCPMTRPPAMSADRLVENLVEAQKLLLFAFREKAPRKTAGFLRADGGHLRP